MAMMVNGTSGSRGYRLDSRGCETPGAPTHVVFLQIVNEILRSIQKSRYQNDKHQGLTLILAC